MWGAWAGKLPASRLTGRAARLCLCESWALSPLTLTPTLCPK